ncbi:MAG TPA: exodeoxyribonuclease VII large subunit [Saprospiraceae bacterium]|nr:exodeoxyribonuclease VII large subunit [Saprospiraceae bacterium]
MQVYSLFDLCQHLRRVVALNFSEPLWITAEIAQLGLSRGHLFIDLVQKGGEEVVAQGQAVIWAKDVLRFRRRFGPAFDEVLREGMEVKMRVRVDFHERFGLKLLPDDIDTTYTFGQIELQRRQSIQQLRDLDLLERNRRLTLAPVLQRIAVISSDTAAGYQDFEEQLRANPFGYTFDTQLFTSAVQGIYAVPELLAALSAVSKEADRFDCVVVLRGGGARLDLAAFDAFDLCKAAATFPLPILTGIGHDTDQTVLDLVAHTPLKTPTAVADFIIQHNLFFENNLLRTAAQLRAAGAYRVQVCGLELERLKGNLHWSARDTLRVAQHQLERQRQQLPLLARHLLRNRAQALDETATLCAALHPEAALRRGFSLTLHKGRVLTSADQADPGALLETRLREGTVWSTVKKGEP